MFRIISRLCFGLCSVFIFSIPLLAADSALSVPNPSFEEVTASGIPDQWTAYSKKYSVDENVSRPESVHSAGEMTTRTTTLFQKSGFVP